MIGQERFFLNPLDENQENKQLTLEDFALSLFESRTFQALVFIKDHQTEEANLHRLSAIFGIVSAEKLKLVVVTDEVYPKGQSFIRRIDDGTLTYFELASVFENVLGSISQNPSYRGKLTYLILTPETPTEGLIEFPS